MAVTLLSLTLASLEIVDGKNCTRDACRAAATSLHAGICPALGMWMLPARARASSHHALQLIAIALPVFWPQLG